MTKDELLSAARGKPRPFEYEGFGCHLLPLPWGELKRLQGGHRSGDADTGTAFTYEVIARAVCDEAGKVLLVPADCELLPLSTIRALSDEVMRLSGLDKESGPGKA